MENVYTIEIIEENLSELHSRIDDANADGSIDECFGCTTVEEAQNQIDVFEEDWHSLKTVINSYKSNK
jgi:hypothetical protein